jgi:hypothetical protein
MPALALSGDRSSRPPAQCDRRGRGADRSSQETVRCSGRGGSYSRQLTCPSGDPPTVGENPFTPRVVGVRAGVLVAAVAAVALGLSGSASLASPAALTATPISWTVVGLDSNSPSSASLPHVYPVGARVCNTGTTAATNVSAKWTWGDTSGTNTIDQAFNGPAQNTAQTIGTLAGGACQDVYFNVDVKQSGGNSSKTHNQNQNIVITADGGLSATETREVYVESLVSQNRNTVKAWAGAGGCNLTYSVCDPAPTHVYVGQQYTFKLYAQTSTAPTTSSRRSRCGRRSSR